METNQYYYQQDKKYYVPTFNRYPITLTRGAGAHVWDVEGNEYIDLLAGIAVNNVGHCHPRVVEALQIQAANLIHISNFYSSRPQVELSEKLARLSGLDRVFMTNSGAESVEGAIKIARKYAHSHKRGGDIISMQNSFHGRTLGTIATGSAKYQQGFEPIPTGFRQVPFNDLKALEEAISTDVAAVILEPVQGEGGINMADKIYLEEVRALCNENDIVLIFDEIQCGIGRTGKMFAKEHFGIQPDIITLAKGLGGGVPMGAILATDKVCEALQFGDHGTTFGGNPLVCAAGLATLAVIEEENLLKEASKKGDWIKKQVDSFGNPHIQEIRGLGLMIGIVYDYETKPIVQRLLKKGLLANATAGNVLRLVPPLNITQEDLGQALEIIKVVSEEYQVNA